ncbi:unnamed protein product, partial [Effrenium voratum]
RRFSARKILCAMKRVALIRHGHSDHNPTGNYSPWWLGSLFSRDTRLTARGQQQAKDLGEKRAGDPHHPLQSVQVVISSPLSRCIETTLLIFGDSLEPPRCVSNLHTERCIMPCDTGRSPEELLKSFPCLAQWQDFAQLPTTWWPKERSFQEELSPKDRVEAFKRYLLARPEEKLAVVGHNGFFSILTGRRMENCEVRWIELSDDSLRII